MTANQQPSFLMLADPFSFETETFVRGLDRVYPLSPKIGGLASGARQVGGTALYLGNQVHHSGCITLALTGNIEVDTVVAQGCRPIGDPMFVTAAHENLIRELDGRPPRDVLARAVRAPAAGRSRAVQPVAVPRPGDAHRRQRIRARRFSDPQHPRHGSAERRAVGERQRARRTASCSSICATRRLRRYDLERTLTRLRRVAPVAARRRRAAVLLRRPRHRAVRPGRSRQQRVPPPGRRRAARRLLLQRRDRPDPERDLPARVYQRVRGVPRKEVRRLRAKSVELRQVRNAKIFSIFLATLGVSPRAFPDSSVHWSCHVRVRCSRRRLRSRSSALPPLRPSAIRSPSRIWCD